MKEFGEGFDRICSEQETNGASVPSFRTDEFILKITVPKVTEKLPERLLGQLGFFIDFLQVNYGFRSKGGIELLDSKCLYIFCDNVNLVRPKLFCYFAKSMFN